MDENPTADMDLDDSDLLSHDLDVESLLVSGVQANERIASWKVSQVNVYTMGMGYALAV